MPGGEESAEAIDEGEAAVVNAGVVWTSCRLVTMSMSERTSLCNCWLSRMAAAPMTSFASFRSAGCSRDETCSHSDGRGVNDRSD